MGLVIVRNFKTRKHVVSGSEFVSASTEGTETPTLFTLERADVSRGIEFEMTEVGIF
jgi:hypothetical protein